MATRLKNLILRPFRLARKYKFRFIILLIILAAAGYFGYQRFLAPQPAPQFTTAAITKGTLSKSITASNNLVSASVFNGGFEAPNTVTEVSVKPGDKVVAGQTLMKTDSSSLAVSLRQAQLAYDMADQSRDNVYKFGGSAIAKRSADIEADLAFAALEQAQHKFNSAILITPIAGTVMQVNYKLGEKVNAVPSNTKDSAEARTAAAVVVMDTSNLQVTIQVSEAEIAEVKVGQKADIRFSTYPMTFTGSVTSVDLIGTQQNNVFFYNVLISFTQTKDEAKVGMIADASIILSEKADVLIAPRNALNYDNDGQYVEVQNGDSFIKKYVKIGTSNDVEVEITEGVNEGEQVKVNLSTDQGGGRFGAMRGG